MDYHINFGFQSLNYNLHVNEKVVQSNLYFRKGHTKKEKKSKAWECASDGCVRKELEGLSQQCRTAVKSSIVWIVEPSVQRLTLKMQNNGSYLPAMRAEKSSSNSTLYTN